MGTNPGSASYSRRQARRAGVGGVAGGNGGAGAVSIANPNAVNAARLTVAQMNTTARMGLRLRDLTPEDARREVSGFTTQQLNTRLMNMEARIRDVSGLLSDVNELSTRPLPMDVSTRVNAARRTGQLSLIGLNRYVNAINGEIAKRG